MKPVIHNLIQNYENQKDKLRRTEGGMSPEQRIEYRVIDRIISDLRSLGSK